MKFSFVLLLLLDFPPLNRQERIKEFEAILLRLEFDPYFDSYIKSCCKFYETICYPLLDSTGYTHELMRGRVTKTEGNGWIEFKISNIRLQHAGNYRCFVLEAPYHIYIDKFFEVEESSIPHSASQPPPTTTIKTLSTSTSIRPESTGPVLSQDNADSPSMPWSFGLPLLVIVSITVMIVITLVMGVVCCRKKAKPEQPDKCGETLCESRKQDATEMSGVVYTTVNFTAREKSKELYSNLRIPKTRAAAPDPAVDTETVEYSTLAIHQ
ncbi:uncharacterized protein LOC128442191 [Pleuronectes platessa]|uniref:uncharacterized protein LOC128442191 n=1 Tax=Pleuronectes platessa TaxID=8262 RepID=UPI00232A6871|nr:uncharacterized protein LOC128442191 [Pleuronectes platessa]